MKIRQNSKVAVKMYHNDYWSSIKYLKKLKFSDYINFIELSKLVFIEQGKSRKICPVTICDRVSLSILSNNPMTIMSMFHQNLTKLETKLGS